MTRKLARSRFSTMNRQLERHQVRCSLEVRKIPIVPEEHNAQIGTCAIESPNFAVPIGWFPTVLLQ
ncbi:hypothetical protein ANCDUO_12096 [Ancylostoma duodenale]|uniref:Uncharacterized protein n=1 Tax=Ancylostoma duodenale TaxID=51022 RepID=A0A0C2CM84_9BILA|nr:hypothetical protein ANCDUO_12096 [Ancylostoma duodenale]